MYSVGNHDECQAWAFTQMIKAMFPQVSVDDSLKPRKCISWQGCFIGVGHCEYTNKAADLFQDFVLDFPAEFADATVREIHTGHLHRESIDNGTMVRRLASGVPTDSWNRLLTPTNPFLLFSAFMVLFGIPIEPSACR